MSHHERLQTHENSPNTPLWIPGFRMKVCHTKAKLLIDLVNTYKLKTTIIESILRIGMFAPTSLHAHLESSTGRKHT